MSRKDYIRFAEMLVKFEQYVGNGITVDAYRNLCSMMADVFLKDNVRFDFSRWNDACKPVA